MQILKFKRSNEDSGKEGNPREKALALMILEDKKLLGNKLVQAGYINVEQLNAACATSVSRGKRLAQVLVEQKLVPASIVSRAMKVALGTVPALEGENISLGEQRLEDYTERSTPQSAIEDEGSDRSSGFASTFKARAANALEVTRDVVVAIKPPADTELTIEEKVYPDSICQDESTEVLYTAIVKNTKRAVAKKVTVSLVNLPPWFKASEVMLDGELMPRLNGELTSLQIGDIAPGESKSIVIVGTASP